MKDDVGLGRCLTVAAERWRRVSQVIGSLAVSVAVPILISAFFHEPQLAGAVRRATVAGCVQR